MANHCVDTQRRTKCNGLHGLQCVWFWCVLLLLFVNRCAVEADDRSSPNAVIYPQGDIFIQVGDHLEIFCVATKNYTAEDLVFTLSGNDVPSEIYNKTAIRLYKENVTDKGRYTYYCKNKRAKNNNNFLKVVFVVDPPANVTDFKCVSKNLEKLNCTWTTPDNIIITDYALTYSMRGDTAEPCVAHFSYNSQVRYCYWNTTSKPRYRQQEKAFHFTLKAENKVGSMVQHFTFDHFSNVILDPPINLTSINSTSHSVRLHWIIHNNIKNFLSAYPLDYKIEYQIAKIDNTSYFRQVDTSSVIQNGKSSYFNLTNLPYAHSQYGVRVYMKLKKASDEFWSDFSNLVIYTASEIPQKPPETIAGAFHQIVFEGERLLYIYWKQLEEYDESGANFTYKILITQGIRTRTYEPNRSKSLGYLYLGQTTEIETLQAMEVRIRSYNEIGSSESSSYMYIPAEEDTKSLSLSSFTKLAYENGTYELSWDGHSSAIDNYTLFWCQHNTSNICSGRINFTVIEPNRNKHIIDLPKNYRYQFAISANKGFKTSGMIWAICDISDEIAMFNYPLRFEDHDAPGKTFVKLKWYMDCNLKEDVIHGYIITYCPVEGTSTTCDHSLGSMPDPYNITDPKQTEATIRNLRPYTTYLFKIALKTKIGVKPIDNTTVSITTLEDTPTKPRDVTIRDVQNNSMVIAWELPLYLNGHINSIRYIIHYNDYNLTVKYDGNLNRVLNGLTAFTNYTISMEACNEGINSCSGRTSPIVVRTRIGTPSIMASPSYNNNKLSWTPPKHYGGTLDGYEIRILKDGNHETLLSTDELSTEVSSCEGDAQNVTYQVRAYNIDTHFNYGTWADSKNVILPTKNDTANETFFGDWSIEYTVLCKTGNSLFLLFVIMGVLVVVGVGCAALRLYKKVRKMEDIKPEFPKELFIPEKGISKFPFTGIYPSDKDEKPTSDEMLLLPDKNSAPSSEIKNSENDNCASSEHTDSTGLSEASQGPVGRQNSTSDESTHSSMHLEDRSQAKEDDASPVERDCSIHSESDNSSESSPYLNDSKFLKNKTTGYVQPVINPGSGYVQTAPAPFKSPLPKMPSQPTTSSYVMAGLPPPIFTPGLSPSGPSQPLPPSGYVRAEDVEARNAMNFPRLGPSPTKVFGSESLPTMPNLPPPTKIGSDSSYIQLQSLDGLPSHKPTVRNTVPFKPAACSGYVRPEDAILNKHINFLSSGQPAEESAILDPAMSPDAYCRFSWSTDPSNDNLHSLLANPTAMNPSKN